MYLSKCPTTKVKMRKCKVKKQNKLIAPNQIPWKQNFQGSDKRDEESDDEESECKSGVNL